MKQIQGFPDYKIDENGVVYSFAKRANRPKPTIPTVKSQFLTRGYPAVDLRKDGRSCKKYVHNLLLETFVCKRPKGYQGRHLNGIRKDIRLCNLKWGTASQNQLDRNKHGTGNAGERHGMSKYTDEFVKKVRKMCETKMQKDVAKELNMPKSTVARLVTQGGWNHI